VFKSHPIVIGSMGLKYNQHWAESLVNYLGKIEEIRVEILGNFSLTISSGTRSAEQGKRAPDLYLEG
jgi:hypothetical protein